MSYDLSIEYAMNKEALVGKFFVPLPKGEWVLLHDYDTEERLIRYQEELEYECQELENRLFMEAENANDDDDWEVSKHSKVFDFA